MSAYTAELGLAAIRKELGRRLRLQRVVRDLRQQDLADRTGIGVATIRRIEDGRSDLRLSILARLLREFDLLDGLDRLVPDPTDSPLVDASALPERVRPGGREETDWQWNDES